MKRDLDMPASMSFTVKEWTIIAVALHEIDVPDESAAQTKMRRQLRKTLKRRLPTGVYERLFGQADREDKSC